VFITAVNAEQFGGHSDWRMPTIKELGSITNLAHCFSPAPVDHNYFPYTKRYPYCWSFTTSASDSSKGWCIGFYYGDAMIKDKSNNYCARAVRGGQTESLNHLLINGDGTVTDTTTGLMWQRATAGEMKWEAAISYCEDLNFSGYDDWRLPNLKELRSIVDFSRFGPAIDTTVFPDTMLWGYHSSTTYVCSPDSVMAIHFGLGADTHSLVNSKLTAYYVRAVRGGQARFPDHLFILSPAQCSVWELGTIMPVTWETLGMPGDVAISISRQGGKTGTFETIAWVTENDGSYDWMVSGTCSVKCVLRIVPLNYPENGTTQGLFSIKEATVLPTVMTSAISSITKTGASSGGYGISDGGADIIGKGVCWRTSENPTIADSHTSDGTGTASFTSLITGLSSGTTYHVRAYATNKAGTGYGDDIAFTSVALNAPEADFNANPTYGIVPLTVNFTNQSTGEITSWLWDFGDGHTSTEMHPVHTYNNPGAYTVSLTVSGPWGADTKTETDYITTVAPPAPEADFNANPTNGVAPLTVNFTDQSTGTITKWSWNFGDGYTSQERNPTHIYRNPCAYSVSLTVANTGGSDTETKTNYIEVSACSYDPVRIGGDYYTAMQDAYDDAFYGDPIQSQALNFSEDLVFDRDIPVTLKGGYDCPYTAQVGDSTVNSMVILNGAVTVEKLTIRPPVPPPGLATGGLPDTGQTQSYTSTFGEDADYLINPLSYTKQDAEGNDLPDSATEWVMVKDNVTGLIWEVKTDDGSIHDKDNEYTWQNAQDVVEGDVLHISSFMRETMGLLFSDPCPPLHGLGNR